MDDKILELLWKYVDGTCNNQEKQEIENLLESDQKVKEEYLFMAGLDQELEEDPAQVEPKLAKNVMEKISANEIEKEVNKSLFSFNPIYFMTLLLVILFSIVIAGFLQDANSSSVSAIDGGILKAFLDDNKKYILWIGFSMGAFFGCQIIVNYISREKIW